jgi:hypothetical protein
MWIRGPNANGAAASLPSGSGNLDVQLGGQRVSLAYAALVGLGPLVLHQNGIVFVGSENANDGAFSGAVHFGQSFRIRAALSPKIIFRCALVMFI